MTEWTMTWRQAGVTKADVKKLVHHHARDVNPPEVTVTAHAGEHIDAARTGWNQTWVNDGAGHMVECTSSDQWLDFIDRRLSEARPNVRRYKDGRVVEVERRKDAAVARDIILQLDPDFTGPAASMTPERMAEVMPHLRRAVDWVTDLYGSQNVVGWSLHMDEKSPHIEMMVVPIDDEGRLRSKSFVKSSKHLAQLQETLFEYMRAGGYEVTRFRPSKGREHMTADEFKQVKNLGTIRDEVVPQAIAARAQYEVAREEAEEEQARAREMIAKAYADATKIRQDAAADATKIRQDAAADATKIRQDAAADASKDRAAARADRDAASSDRAAARAAKEAADAAAGTWKAAPVTHALQADRSAAVAVFNAVSQELARTSLDPRRADAVRAAAKRVMPEPIRKVVNEDREGYRSARAASDTIRKALKSSQPRLSDDGPTFA